MLESRKECTRSSMKNRLWREVGSRETKVEFWRAIQGRGRGPDIGRQSGQSEVTDLSDPLSFQVSFVIKIQFLNVCVCMCVHAHDHARTHGHMHVPGKAVHLIQKSLLWHPKQPGIQVHLEARSVR